MFRNVNWRLKALASALLLVCTCLPQAQSQLPKPLQNFSLPSDILDQPTQHPSGSLVCRKETISGLESVHDYASTWVGSNTDDPASTKVYISVEQGALYLQSNFVTRGFEYPTKIRTDRTDVDLKNLAFNLIGRSEASGVSRASFLAAFPKMHFFVDDGLFSDAKFKELDFSRAPEVQVIGSDHKARNSRVFVTENGDGRRIVEFEDDLYAFAGSADAAMVFERLRYDRFRSADVRLLPAVLNSDTQSAVSSRIPEMNRLMVPDLRSESLENAIKGERGKLVFVLGHIEDSSLVVIDAAGQEISRIPIAQLVKVGKDNDVRVFMLGCNSATVGGAGVATTFNTVDATQRFASALGAVTWLGFYQRLAGPQLQLVLDSSTLGQDGGEAELKFYERVPTRTRIRQVGSVTHSFGAAPPAATSDGNGSSGGDDSDYTLWVLFGVGVIGVAMIIFYKQRTAK